MHYYPIFIRPGTLRVLVVGAGRVGTRKIVSLSKAGTGDILVVDPGLNAERLNELNAMPNVHARAQYMEKADLRERTLVFAATNDKAENQRIAAMCDERGILCNVVDSPSRATFHVPTVVETHGLVAAFGTGGQSPALVKRIKEDAAEWLDSHYVPLLIFMRRLRPLVLAKEEETEENSNLFRAVVHSDLGKALANNDMAMARRIASGLLPPDLLGHIEELLDGLG